jgi:hypothetical protein
MFLSGHQVKNQVNTLSASNLRQFISLEAELKSEDDLNSTNEEDYAIKFEEFDMEKVLKYGTPLTSSTGQVIQN